MQVPNLDRFHDFLFALFDASAIIGTQEVICIYVILWLICSVHGDGLMKGKQATW